MKMNSSKENIVAEAESLNNSCKEPVLTRRRQSAVDHSCAELKNINGDEKKRGMLPSSKEYNQIIFHKVTEV